MEWYFILLIIIGGLFLLILLISFICYYMSFFHHEKIQNTNRDEVSIPNDPIYVKHKELIVNDITEVKKYPYQEISIKTFDGLILKGKYFEYDKKEPIEIMFHGYKGSAERDLSTGVKRAFRCQRNALLVDQRAHGRSQGHTISFGVNESKDCLCWINKVIEIFGEDVKIILTGISMGAATVAIASGYDLPKNVIGILADCGYHSQKEIIKLFIKNMKLPLTICYPFVKLGALLYGRFRLEKVLPIEQVKKAKVPIIFIHGESDDFVPCYMSKKMYDACTTIKKLVTIPNAGHGISCLENPDKYVDELNKFFFPLYK